MLKSEFSKIKIKVRDDNITLDVKIIWVKNLSDGGVQYGCAFSPGKNQGAIRRLIISHEAQGETDDVVDFDKKRSLIKFWNIDFVRYINDLEQIFITAQTQTNFDDEVFEQLKAANNEIVQKAEFICSQFTDKVFIRKFRHLFRLLGGHWFYSSDIMRKAFRKYRGYPGDFEMMEYIYNQKETSFDIFSQYFDKYFIDNAYSRAVRGRKDKMVEILDTFLCERFPRKKALNILNLACGPCREIREVFSKSKECYGLVNFVCVDQDKDALTISDEFIRALPLKGDTGFQFLEGNLLHYFKYPAREAVKLGKKFDLVYSIGLADYFPDKILSGMISFALRLLNKNGVFILAHKIEERDAFAPLPPKWFCDWLFVPRTVEDVKKLIAMNLGSDCSIMHQEWEGSKKVIFLMVRKN